MAVNNTSKTTAKYHALSDIKTAQSKISAENKVRDNAKNILNLARLSGMDKTQAERVLEEITKNSSVLQSGTLTLEDLRRFNAAFKALSANFQKNKIQGGIHPRVIINRSRRVDIERSDKQIPVAKPVSITSDGVVKFWVSASAKSKDRCHYVAVQFLNFGAAVSANRVTNEILDMVTKGAVKFDCDCGRHRFWYRYIATVGSYYYGRPESGFPKIRNPNLGGLACKHVIKVMNLILKSQTFKAYMKASVERYQNKPNASGKSNTDKQLGEMVKKIQKESWVGKGTRRSKTGADKLPENAFSLSKPKSIKGAKLTPMDISKQRAAGKSNAQKNDEKKRAQMLQKLNGLSTEQLEKLLKGI